MNRWTIKVKHLLVSARKVDYYLTDQGQKRRLLDTNSLKDSLVSQCCVSHFQRHHHNLHSRLKHNLGSFRINLANKYASVPIYNKRLHLPWFFFHFVVSNSKAHSCKTKSFLCIWRVQPTMMIIAVLGFRLPCILDQVRSLILSQILRQKLWPSRTQA